MKKIYLITGLILLMHAALTAQVITSITPQVGDVFQNSATFGINDSGEAGFDITWDFSAASFADNGVSTVVPASEVPLNELFPNADLAFVAEIAGVGIFYSFFDYNGGNWTDHGTANIGGSPPELVFGTIYSDPYTYFTTPLSASSSGNDTYAGELITSFSSATITGTSSWSVDGSGTVILPNATYNDVLRVRIESEETLVLDGIPIDIVTTSVSHYWLKQGIPFPLVVTSFTSENFGGIIEEEFGAGALVSYSTATSARSDQASLNAQFTAFPNPFANMLTLVPNVSVNKVLGAVIRNIEGQVVQTYTAYDLSADPSIRLDLEFLKAGMYIIEIQHDQGASFIKLLKSH